MNKKYILGCGISGLIFAYYNPEYTVISPDIGGQLTHGIYKMTWVHHTPETEQLVLDCGLEVKPTKTLMGYYYDCKINDECSIEANEKIIQKKMADWTIKPGNFKIEDRVLSVPGNFINTLDTDFGDIIKILSSRISVINDYVVKIDKHKIYCQNGEYEYDQLVSTIPSNIFWKIYSEECQKPDLISSPVTFIVSNDRPDWFDEKYEMVYIAEDYYYNRLAYRGDKYYTYEFTGVMPEDVFSKLYGYEVIKHFVNNSGRIKTSVNESPQNNIRFLGRFAEHVHSSKIQDVIKFALNNKL